MGRPSGLLPRLPSAPGHASQEIFPPPLHPSPITPPLRLAPPIFRKSDARGQLLIVGKISYFLFFAKNPKKISKTKCRKCEIDSPTFFFAEGVRRTKPAWRPWGQGGREEITLPQTILAQTHFVSASPHRTPSSPRDTAVCKTTGGSSNRTPSHVPQIIAHVSSLPMFRLRSRVVFFPT